MEEGYVRLLDVQPSLGAGLPRADRAEARRLTLAPLLTLTPGSRRPAEIHRELARREAFAGVVVDGLIAHDVVLAGRAATHLLGPGDVFAPGVASGPGLRVPQRLGLAEATPVALLDGSFSAAVRKWPSIAESLLLQTERQAQRLRVQGLIAHLPGAEERVLALLWHLADRWGRLEPEGVVVPVLLGHEAIARLVGGRRPTISAALGRLSERRHVVRRANGTWLLDPASRAQLAQPALALRPTSDVRLLSAQPAGRLARRPVR